MKPLPPPKVTKTIVPFTPTPSINYILRVVESKGKGKALPTMDYEDMQDDDEWASEFSSEDEDDFDLSKAYMSVCARQVQEILSGTEGTATGASGSSFVAGRVTEIIPRTPGEFRLAREALSMAHNEGCPNTNDLLAAIRQFVSRCHQSARKEKVHHYAIKHWVVPDWAEKMRYDPATKQVVLSGVTKGKARASRPSHKKGGAVEHNRLLTTMARRHQLMIGGAPHPHLGNISSPRHEDHPLVWKEWTQHIAKVIPKGLAIGPDGSAFERHI
jgi:hypothetical protein